MLPTQNAPIFCRGDCPALTVWDVGVKDSLDIQFFKKDVWVPKCVVDRFCQQEPTNIRRQEHESWTGR